MSKIRRINGLNEKKPRVSEGRRAGDSGVRDQVADGGIYGKVDGGVVVER